MKRGMKRKLLSTILALCLVFILLPMAVLADPPEPTVWDGTVEAFALLDSGQANAADNPYIIDTAAKLAQLSVSVNSGVTYEGKHFRLTENLNLNERDWTPIGADDLSCFNGIFDGYGHSISGLNVNQTATGKNAYAGLFGWLNGGWRH